jgi:hypothetical protein
MNSITDVTEEQLGYMFEWLDDLRDSGRINMFGAPPLLAQAFDLEGRVAKDVWLGWTQTCDGEAEASTRAAKHYQELHNAEVR